MAVCETCKCLAPIGHNREAKPCPNRANHNKLLKSRSRLKKLRSYNMIQISEEKSIGVWKGVANARDRLHKRLYKRERTKIIDL